MAASHLRAAEKDLKWWVYYDTTMASWTEYRDALAARLTDDDFETVSQSTMELARLHGELAKAPKADLGFRPMPQSGPAFLVMRDNATKAWNVLAGPAKGSKMTGLLHDHE